MIPLEKEGKKEERMALSAQRSTLEMPTIEILQLKLITSEYRRSLEVVGDPSNRYQMKPTVDTTARFALIYNQVARAAFWPGRQARSNLHSLVVSSPKMRWDEPLYNKQAAECSIWAQKDQHWVVGALVSLFAWSRALGVGLFGTWNSEPRRIVWCNK